MRSAAFYYHPSPGPLKKVDLGGRATNLIRQEVRRKVITESKSGARTEFLFSARNRIQISYELLCDFGVRREVQALINHLKRGGVCSFALDADGVYAGFALSNPDRGSTSVAIAGNMFQEFEPSVIGPAGQEVVIQSPSPRMLYQELAVDTVSNDVVAFVAGDEVLDERFLDAQWVMLRDKRFWPFLILPKEGQDGSFLTPSPGIRADLEIVLEEPPNVLASFSQQSDSLFMGETFGASLLTLEQYETASSGTSELPGSVTGTFVVGQGTRGL
jgi:hypothetical protein